ncbi:hypothetical protein E4U09_002980 [Claviceps aff. purpurea]|uniref:Uncharacterized protein n=1 Tax=Claviceps aff. purpurea TaxID=1967640 RepID=A0A9P7U5I2_9HYPO|nr:hypothetical protein E4U09_002980 [Claviceps aff. purpurea]
MLRRTFCEDCEHWTLTTWEKAVPTRAKKCATSLKSTASTLAKDREARSQKISTVSLPGTYDDDGEIEKPKEPKTDMHFDEQGDLVTDDGNELSASFQQQFERQQAELVSMTAKLEAAQEITAKIEAAHLDNSRSRQGSSSKTPDICTWMPDSFNAIGITDDQIRRCLADFDKMYKDSDKYSGERYHFMSRKFDTLKD